MFLVLAGACEVWESTSDYVLRRYTPFWARAMSNEPWSSTCYPLDWWSDHELVLYRGMSQPT